MKVGKRIEVTASRWPWQIVKSVGILGDPQRVGKPFGWKPIGGMGRFGGGWEYNLGISIGKKSVVLDLAFGSIRIAKQPLCPVCKQTIWSGEAGNGLKIDLHGNYQYKCHTRCFDEGMAYDE